MTTDDQGMESPMISDASSENPIGAARQASRSGAKRVVRTLIFGVAVAGIVFLVRHKPAKSAASTDQPTIPAIETSVARRGDMGVYIEALGNVTPTATINVYSQVTGVVVAVNYIEGQMIRRGDPLIDIDPRPYQAQLQQVEGTLERDRLLLQQAEMDLKRYEEASGEKAIARQQYDDQKLLVSQDQASIKNDVGQLQYAQVQLGYCHLTSPINGRIGLRLVDPGNTVFSGGSSPLVVVTQLRPITVVFDIAEDHLGAVRNEITRRQSLSVDAFDRSLQNKIATGKLLTLDNQVDTSTGTIRFRGEFSNSDLQLFPNQFVNARLRVNTLHDVVLIPSAAVQRNGVQAYVYIVSGNRAKMHDITELLTEGETSAVRGIDAGEIVATTSFDKLQDGQQVNVQATQTSSVQPSVSSESGR